MKYRKELVKHTDFSIEEGYKAARDLLSRKTEKPTAPAVEVALTGYVLQAGRVSEITEPSLIGAGNPGIWTALKQPTVGYNFPRGWRYKGSTLTDKEGYSRKTPAVDALKIVGNKEYTVWDKVDADVK